jgi:exosortase
MNDTDTIPTGKPDAWHEFRACWQRLPNKGFFFALLAAWLALFQFLGNSTLGYFHSPSLFRYMSNAYNNAGLSSDEALGNVIPFVVVGLFWWKRHELLKLPLKLWPPALLLVALGLALHIAGYLIEEPRISIVALFTGIYGLTGLAWGRQWLRKSFFPFSLFVFCVPVSEFIEPVTLPLRILVSTLTEWVAHYILGIGVLRMGTQLFDPLGTYQYDVVAACSGIRSFMAIFLLATVYGFITFRSPWKRLFLMALALPFSVLGNLVRMLCIIITAAMGGQEWGNYVHEGGPMGIISLLPYVPAILGLLFAGRWLETKSDPEENPPA